MSAVRSGDATSRPLAGADASVGALEARLRAQPTVDDARAIVAGGGVHALVVPNAAGRARLRGHGWLTYAEDLEIAIAPAAVAAWRFVERIDGTLDAEALRALVLAPLPRTPDLLDARRDSAHAVTLALHVPLDVAVCREHFPRAPIVPGVVQLGWAEAFARAWLPVEGRFAALEVVKFHHVVQPGDRLDLRLEWLAADRRLKMHGATAHGRVLSGRMVFAAP